MAALIVVDDLFLSIIKENMYVLELLDFSSASYQISRSIFNTVFLLTLDLLMQSFNSFDLIWQALYVSICTHTFVFALVHSDIPQYSVLVPIHFSMNFTPLHTIIDSHALTLYELTDHIQLQMSAEKMLYLNENKTILIIVSTKYLYTLLLVYFSQSQSANKQNCL